MTTDDPDDATEEETFEEGLERLETIVADLESGELALEDAFDEFEEGVALARDLRERLETVEARVQELLDDGTLEDRSPEDA